MQDDEFTVGYPEEWRRFQLAHPKFETAARAVVSICNELLSRKLSGVPKVDVAVFFMGCLCLEDFDEIILLAGNGKGFGCQKILRGMFERHVTAAYLHSQPAEAAAFFEFELIRTHKLWKRAFDTFGDEAITASSLAQVKAEADAVKPHFMVKTCRDRNCQEERVNHNWTKTDLVSMAEALGPTIKSLLLTGYYIPMLSTHPTLADVMQRMTTDELTLAGSNDQSRLVAGRSLGIAHAIMLEAIALQGEHFPEVKQRVDDVMPKLLEGYEKCWGKPAS